MEREPMNQETKNAARSGKPSFQDWLPAIIGFTALALSAGLTFWQDDRANDRAEEARAVAERARVAGERARLRTLQRTFTLNATLLEIIVQDQKDEASGTSCKFPGDRYLLSENGVAAAEPQVEQIAEATNRATVNDAIDGSSAFNLRILKSEALTCGELVTTASGLRKQLLSAADQVTMAADQVGESAPL